MLGVAEHGRVMRTTPLFLRGAALKCMHLTSVNLLNPAVAPSREAISSFTICLSALAGWDKVSALGMMADIRPKLIPRV